MSNVVSVITKTGLDIKGVTILMPMSTLHSVSLIHDKGYNVKVIDQRIDEKWKQTLKKEINQNPVCVGITTMTGKQIDYSLEVAKFIRSLNPNMPIVWGGVHPSLLPEQTLENEYVDIVVIGEGERTLLELVKALENRQPLDKIKGLGYKKDNKIIINEPRLPEDLNEMPDVPYDLVNVKDYFIQTYESPKTLSFLSGKGCPYRCSYCYNIKFNNRRWRPIEAEKIVNRIKKLLVYEPEAIEFVDDLFFVDRKRNEKICKLIIKEGIKLKFIANCRVDFIARNDIEFFKLIKKAGFNELYIGLETGSKKSLLAINKDSTLEDVDIANKKLKEVGIKPIYSFMGGFPGETGEDLKQTVDLMIKLNKENPYASLTSMKTFTPFTGTPLFETCKKNGFKVPKTLEGWAKFDYTTAIYKWGSKKDMNLLHKLTYMTYFLDQKSISNQLARDKPLLKTMMNIYGKIVKFRCKHHFYAFTPEIKFMELFKEKVIN
jgi:anaerobic magnesium-protoporphyrin IX monomethyl ester cyclase